MTDYIAVLRALYPGAQWSLSDNNYDTLEWYEDTPKPTQAELDAAWPQVDHDNQVAAVEDARRADYEATSDPLFFEWQRGDGTEQAWLDAVAAVKAAHPYPPAP
ncbi:MAG TPA: hypothetical protein VIG24_13795 [Acidimicrobiia bacterium]